MEGDIITMQDLFKFEQEGVGDDGKAYGAFTSTGLRPGFLDRIKAHGAELPASLFERRVLPSDRE